MTLPPPRGHGAAAPGHDPMAPLLLIPPRGYALHGCPLEVTTWDGSLGDTVTLALAVPELQLTAPPRILTRWALVEHDLAPLHAILELWHALEDRQAELILAGGSCG